MQNVPYLDDLLGFAKSFEGNVWKFCSAPGEFKTSNISFMNSTFSQKFPPGDYRATFRIYDDVDENIFNLTYYSSNRK